MIEDCHGSRGALVQSQKVPLFRLQLHVVNYDAWKQKNILRPLIAFYTHFEMVFNGRYNALEFRMSEERGGGGKYIDKKI